MIRLSVLFFLIVSLKASWLGYLNFLRQSCGEVALKENLILDKAALNHSIYVNYNKIFSHFEKPNLPYFTGITPKDRAFYVGYKSALVLENLSESESLKDSIDGLFSAVYHRFAFLNITINEIGMGQKGKIYTYNMGNSNLNAICGKKFLIKSGYYYYEICKDEKKKIPKKVYDRVINNIKRQNPKIVRWPVERVKVPPVFYEEIPDPLPDRKVSGYPVSVEFNDYYFKKVKVEVFKLYDSNKNEIETIFLNKLNDPNNKLTDKQFVIFPKNRLDWGKKYYVVLKYRVKNKVFILKWHFFTKDLLYPYFKISKRVFTAYVKPNKYYAFYFVPKNKNDWLRNLTYNNSKLDIKWIDNNTILVKFNSNFGKSRIEFGNGNVLNIIVRR